MEQSEENTGIAVEETIGDAAYGDGGTRQAFADAGRTLIAKVPGRPRKDHFPKEDFQIDLAAGACTCPAGQVTHTLRTMGTRTNRLGQTYPVQSFQFDPKVCGACPLRSQCVAAGEGKGRTVTLHPQEALLQQARAFQKSEDFAEYRGRRQVVEHRLARLVQLGVRQSRRHGGQPDPGGYQDWDDVPGPGSSPNKPENRPDRPAAGACPEFATGSPIVTAQFILVAASWAALSLRPGPVHWLSSTSSRHSRAFQPGF